VISSSSPWALAAGVLSLWTARLVTAPMYYARTSQLGWYGADGDAIALVVVGDAIVTLIGFPIVAWLLWAALRDVPRTRWGFARSWSRG
jgi:hypothetical protein